MVSKCDYQGLETSLGSGLDGTSNELLVTEVHSIKHADGDGRAPGERNLVELL